MSEFRVEVVRVTQVEKHPNADTLSIAKVAGDYPVIFQTGTYQEGSLAVHVPIDSVVPEGDPRWEFLGRHRRIKAKRLRGIFSMGLLTDAASEWVEGRCVQAELGIEKYEPQIRLPGRHGLPWAGSEPAPGWFPRYTDLEALRRNPGVLVDGEEVVVTEKIHGANGRWAYGDGRHWVGSHNHARKLAADCPWWRAMYETGLDRVVERCPGLVFFGELHGELVQDLDYGVDGVTVRVFDVFDSSAGKYLDWRDFVALCVLESVPMAPVLYHGPWDEAAVRAMAEGRTTLPGDHVREGVVVRPIVERWDRRVGRVVLKHVGEGYLLRKGA